MVNQRQRLPPLTGLGEAEAHPQCGPNCSVLSPCRVPGSSPHPGLGGGRFGGGSLPGWRGGGLSGLVASAGSAQSDATCMTSGARRLSAPAGPLGPRKDSTSGLGFLLPCVRLGTLPPQPRPHFSVSSSAHLHLSLVLVSVWGLVTGLCA